MEHEFVFGRIDKEGKADWYLLLCPPDTTKFAMGVMRDGVSAAIRGSVSLKTGIGPEHEMMMLLLSKAVDQLSTKSGWLMNRNGGMFTHLHCALQTKRGIDFPGFPTIDDVELSQWTYGTHWYARLYGRTDIEWKRKGKWDSYAEAKEAASKYLEAFFEKSPSTA